ncbi:hypothetical protein SAMN05442782_2318 [Streptomyces sp. OK228]|nr:hypothetical protein SAMN05442782_2318 [Streptomyces sp. OK228]
MGSLRLFGRPWPTVGGWPPARALPCGGRRIRSRASSAGSPGVRRRPSPTVGPGLPRRRSPVARGWFSHRVSPGVGRRSLDRARVVVGPGLARRAAPGPGPCCGPSAVVGRLPSRGPLVVVRGRLSRRVRVPRRVSPGARSGCAFGSRRPRGPTSGLPGPGIVGCGPEPGRCRSAAGGGGERVRAGRRRWDVRGSPGRRRRRRLRAGAARAGDLGVRARGPRVDRRGSRASLVARSGVPGRRPSAGGRRPARRAPPVASRGCLCRPLPVANRRLPCRLPRGRLSRCAPPPCEPPR